MKWAEPTIIVGELSEPNSHKLVKYESISAQSIFLLGIKTGFKLIFVQLDLIQILSFYFDFATYR